MENIFDTWLIKQPIAHRGLHDDTAPENSLAAFENAIKHGYAIELDVHMTRDGELVVFHDDSLDRMTDATGDLREKGFNEIFEITLKGSEEKIPLLSEVLKLVDGKVPLLIEVKDHKHIGIAEEKIKDALENYHGKFALQSFNPFIVKWFKKNTDFTTGLLSCFFEGVPLATINKILLKNLTFLRYTKADFVSYEYHAATTYKKIKKLKNKLPILFWTVPSQEEADKFKEYCDNIIFEGFLPKND